MTKFQRQISVLQELCPACVSRQGNNTVDSTLRISSPTQLLELRVVPCVISWVAPKARRSSEAAAHCCSLSCTQFLKVCAISGLAVRKGVLIFCVRVVLHRFVSCCSVIVYGAIYFLQPLTDPLRRGLHSARSRKREPSAPLRSDRTGPLRLSYRPVFVHLPGAPEPAGTGRQPRRGIAKQHRTTIKTNTYTATNKHNSRTCTNK